MKIIALFSWYETYERTKVYTFLTLNAKTKRTGTKCSPLFFEKDNVL